jgi:hypothetical protein
MSKKHPSTEEVESEHGHDRLKGETVPESLEPKVSSPQVEPWNNEAFYDLVRGAGFPGSPYGDAAFMAACWKLSNPAAPPTLSSLDPEECSANTALEITLTGTGFDAKPMVYLGSAFIAPSSISDTSLVVSVGTSAVEYPGTLQVRVTNSDGQSTGELPFTVT